MMPQGIGYGPAHQQLMNQQPSFDVSRARVDRSRKMAEALRTNNRQVPDGKMVGRHYVPPSIFQQMQPIAGALGGAYVDRQTDVAESQLNQREQKAFQDWTSAIPRARMVSRRGAERAPTVPNDDDGNPMPNFAPMETNLESPTRADRMQWLTQGMAIPQARAAASKGFVEQMDMQPKAIGESMYADAEGNVQQNPAWTENKRMALEQRQREIQDRLADRRLDRESRERMETLSAENRRAIAELVAVTRMGTARIQAQGGVDRAEVAAAGKGKGPSEKAMKEMAMMDADESSLLQGIEMMEAALAKANASNQGTGTGIIPGMISEYAGPAGQSFVNKYMRTPEINDAVQFITYLTDGIRHGRFGSALTKVEKASAGQYLPSATDDAQQIINKARGLYNLLVQRHGILRQGYQPPASEDGSAPLPPTPPARGTSGSSVPASGGQSLPQSTAPGGSRAAPVDQSMGGKSLGTGSWQSPLIVTDDESFDRVPQGMIFVGPDGVKRVKP